MSSAPDVTTGRRRHALQNHAQRLNRLVRASLLLKQQRDRCPIIGSVLCGGNDGVYQILYWMMLQ